MTGRNIFYGCSCSLKGGRCEMCLDWTAELADISVGDYLYHPPSEIPKHSSSSVLVRTGLGEEIFRGAQNAKYIVAESVPSAYIISSGTGFELKKHIAAFKLLHRQRYGWPVPNYHYRPSYAPLMRDMPTLPDMRRENADSDFEKPRPHA